jgi:predicted dehydrogenase
VPSYGNSGRLLADHGPDAVIVASTDETHAELALAALAAGAHVLVEKPIARQLDEAKAMCHAAERAGRVLVTVCNKRYAPAYAEAKRLLDGGRVPRPSLLDAKFTLGYGYVDLLESGTVHMFDLTRFLLGDVARVSAVGSPDEAVVTLEFAAGPIGAVSTTARALSLHPWERVEIFGDGAWLAVDDASAVTLHPAEYEPAETWAPVPPNTLTSAEQSGGYVGMLEEFLAAARGGEPRATALWDGYRALELVVATRRSLERRAPVDLPLEGKEG